MYNAILLTNAAVLSIELLLARRIDLGLQESDGPFHRIDLQIDDRAVARRHQNLQLNFLRLGRFLFVSLALRVGGVVVALLFFYCPGVARIDTR